jgi:predicted permease
MNRRTKFCLKVYRRLASAYPHEFRMLYGEDMDRAGEDSVPEAWRRYRMIGLARLLADIAWGLPARYMAEIRQDAAYALRRFGASPGFPCLAVLSLSTGIGMCCAVLSELKAFVGSPPGIPDPGSLVTTREPVAYPYFESYRDMRQTGFQVAALLTMVPFAVAPAEDRNARSERVRGHLVSPEYFSTLGLKPLMGRFFSPDLEKQGMAPVVVVSERLWRRRLGADQHAVGRTIRLNGRAVTIVGVAPQKFLGIWPAIPADVVVPLTCAGALAPELRGDPLHRADLAIFRVVLRLLPGTSIGAAEASLETATRNFDRENGLDSARDRGGKSVRLMPAGTRFMMTPEQSGFLDGFNFALWALVLTLACANLANLLLARGNARKKEIAIRLSVGASRARLVRQFLMETVLLSLAGGAGGVALAYGITHLICSVPMPSPLPMEYDFRPDGEALLLTLGIAIATGIGFGLVPALSSARSDVGRALKEGCQAPLRGYRRFGLRNLFVVCQMAASLMLLAVTWYIASGFWQQSRLDPGFELANLNLFSIDPIRDGYSVEDAATLFATVPEELSHVHGVRIVSLADSIPFSNLAAEQPNTRVMAPTGQAGEEQRSVFRMRIGSDYFAAAGIGLVGGREFDRCDQGLVAARPESGRAIPAVLNQKAARDLFGDENPIGRRLWEGNLNYTIVGLARDVHSGFLVTKPVPTLYLPLTLDWLRNNPGQRATFLLRGTTGREVLEAVRERLASLHPDVTMFDPRTMKEDLDRLNAFVQWDSTIYMILGVFALLLACIGLGGVTVHAVTQRRKEIGIRMALGARGPQIQGLVLKEGVALVMAGSVFGLAGAYAIVRAFANSPVLAQMMAGRGDDPLFIIAAPLALASLAMLACYLPARRATEIDPMSALRTE